MDIEKHRNNRNIENENVSVLWVRVLFIINTRTLFLNNVVEKIKKNKLCSKVIKQIAPVQVFTLLM